MRHLKSGTAAEVYGVRQLKASTAALGMSCGACLCVVYRSLSAGHGASSHEYPFLVVYRSGDFGVKLDRAVLKNYRIEGIMIPLGRVLAISSLSG